MISVSIAINGVAILARSAVNTGRTNKFGYGMYRCDDGTTILHKTGDGAVVLAHKLLDRIIEQGIDPKVPASADILGEMADRSAKNEARVLNPLDDTDGCT